MPSARQATHHRLQEEEAELDARLAEFSTIERAAALWWLRRQDGLDALEATAFESWLHADVTHRIAYDDIAAAWAAIDHVPESDRARLKPPATQARSRSADPAVRCRTLQRPLRTPWAFHLAFACAALMIAAAIAGTLVHQHWDRQPLSDQRYATARGQQQDIVLADGSQLALDSASQAQALMYRSRREVRLQEGQVLLAVHGDTARPFDVVAGPVRITVTGTRFAVRYVPSTGRHDVSVAVEEGQVAVALDESAAASDAARRGHPRHVVLRAGQRVRVNADGGFGPTQKVDGGDVALWRAHRVNFDDIALADALAELSRYGSTGVVIRDNSVLALRVTGSVDVRRMDDFIRNLPLVLPVRLVPRDGTWEVAPRATRTQR